MGIAVKISFFEISKAYQSYLKDGVHSRQAVCPTNERILASVLSDVSREEKELIASHAANCYECSQILIEAQKISSGIDNYVDRSKALIKPSGKANGTRNKRRRPWIVGYKPAVISAALLCILICGLFIFVPRMRFNSRAAVSKEQISVISPVNIEVRVADLQFKWKKVPNSKYYLIELFDSALCLVWRSEPIDEIMAGIPADTKAVFQPGTYYWILTAIRLDDTSLKSDLKEFAIYR